MTKDNLAVTGRSFTLGRVRFAKISAVEGLRLSSAAQKEFKEDQRQQATPAQRRQRILAKYAAQK